MEEFIREWSSTRYSILRELEKAQVIFEHDCEHTGVADTANYTRSRYHQLAFLVLLQMSESDDVQYRRDLIERTFTRANAKLDDDDLRYDPIQFDDELINECEQDCTDILKSQWLRDVLESPDGLDVTVQVPQSALNAFKARLHANFGWSEKACARLVQEAEEEDAVTVITRVSQQATWKQPWSDAFGEEEYWEMKNATLYDPAGVPLYSVKNVPIDDNGNFEQVGTLLASSAEAFINALGLESKQQERTHHGATITTFEWNKPIFGPNGYTIEGDEQEIPLVRNILNGQGDEEKVLTANWHFLMPRPEGSYEINEQDVMLHLGIYEAFEGTQSITGFTIDDVIVSLSSAISFSDTQASMEQKQEVVGIPRNASVSGPTDVYVDVFGGRDRFTMLSSRTDVQARFTTPQNSYADFDSCTPCPPLHIKIDTKEGTSMWFLNYIAASNAFRYSSAGIPILVANELGKFAALAASADATAAVKKTAVQAGQPRAVTVSNQINVVEQDATGDVAAIASEAVLQPEETFNCCSCFFRALDQGSGGDAEGMVQPLLVSGDGHLASTRTGLEK